MSNDSIFKTITVAFVLCIFCAMIVSATATQLKPYQEANKLLDRQMNVLKAAGLLGSREAASASQIREMFSKVEARVVDLDSGRSLDSETPDQVSSSMEPIPKEQDFAGIKSRPEEVVVYLVKKEDGSLDSVVLPIYGRGLWSVMYGFLALDGDLCTVRNISFYENGETPGLGGEIANPAWTGKWVGKKAFDEKGEPVLRIVKGLVNAESPMAESEIDGISGATLTGNGVNNTVRYWLGRNGFGEYLENMKADEQK